MNTKYINGKKAKKQLDKLIQNCKIRHRHSHIAVEVEFDSSQNTGDGVYLHSLIDKNVAKILIGCKGVNFLGVVNTEDFVKLSLCILHEFEHHEQYNVKFSKPEFINMAINKMADMNNDYYNDANYIDDLSEIDANICSIEKLIEYNKKLKVNNLDKYIVDIMEERRQNGLCFASPDKRYDNINDLLSGMKSKYLSVNAQKPFVDLSGHITMDETNELYHFLNQKWGIDGIEDAFAKITDGNDQMVFLAMVYAQMHIGTEEIFPNIRNLDYIFGENAQQNLLCRLNKKYNEKGEEEKSLGEKYLRGETIVSSNGREEAKYDHSGPIR